MREEQAKTLVKKTFESPFDKGRFTDFVRNLLNKMNEEFESFRDSVRSLDRIGQYTDPDGKIIDILIVRLKKRDIFRAGEDSPKEFYRQIP